MFAIKKIKPKSRSSFFLKPKKILLASLANSTPIAINIYPLVATEK